MSEVEMKNSEVDHCSEEENTSDLPPTARTTASSYSIKAKAAIAAAAATSALSSESISKLKIENSLCPSPATDESTEDTSSSLSSLSSASTDILQSKFEEKFIQLLNRYAVDNQISKHEFLMKHIWVLNQLIVPMQSANSSNLSCGNLKLRYGQPESEIKIYNHVKKDLLKQPDVTLTSRCDQFSADIVQTQINNHSFKNNSIIQRSHVHTLQANNFSGGQSLPLVIFPRNESLDSTGLDNASIVKTLSIAETHNGDLNDLSHFLAWLKRFANEPSKEAPLILLVNSFLYLLLFQTNISQNSAHVKAELAEFCKEKQIYLLFYPLNSSLEPFNLNVRNHFVESWKETLLKFSTYRNPHSKLAFIQIYKQAMRKLFSPESPHRVGILKMAFTQLLTQYKSILNNINDIDAFASQYFDAMDVQFNIIINRKNEQLKLESIEPSTNNNIITETNSSETDSTAATTAVAAPTQNQPAFPKHTDQELNELTAWINEMSKIGCLCLKYTYLRELQLRHRPKQLSTSKELIAPEQKWNELMRKIQSRLLYTNENEYVTKWFDTNTWRQAFFKFIRDESQCTEADSMWTFELMQFPYVKGVVHTPENDYARRPRNFKMKISVLFAFNAAGDYMEPYFVYPDSFQEDQTKISTERECFSHNGYVTCRTFEQWLNSFLFTHLAKNKKQEQHKQQNIALLYCAKLAVFDSQNLNLCKQYNVKPFCITDEKTKPFTLLFQKSARKRQTDLFLESWKKVTTKSGQSCQFKCNLRQEFFNLFTDAFQNCIEETANKMNESAMDQHNGSMNSSQSTAVSDFKIKMFTSFEQSKMWPVKEEDYKEFFKEDDKQQTKEETEDVSLKQNNNLINLEPMLDSEPNQINKQKKSRKSTTKSVVLETNVKEKPDLKRKLEVEEKKLDHSRQEENQDEDKQEEENEEEEDDDEEEEEEEEDDDDDDEQNEAIDSDENFEPENKRRRTSSQRPNRRKKPFKSTIIEENDNTKVKPNKTKQKTPPSTITTINETTSKTSLSPNRKLIYDLVVGLLQKIFAEQTKNGKKSQHINGTLIDFKTKLKAKSKNLNPGPDFLEKLIENLPDLISTETARASFSSQNRDKINELCDFLCNFYEQKNS